MTKTDQPTNAQRRMMLRLAAGNRIGHYRSSTFETFRFEKGGTANAGTVRALLDRGWVGHEGGKQPPLFDSGFIGLTIEGRGVCGA